MNRAVFLDRDAAIAAVVVEAMGLSGVKFSYTGGRRGWRGDIPLVSRGAGGKVPSVPVIASPSLCHSEPKAKNLVHAKLRRSNQIHFRRGSQAGDRGHCEVVLK